jgi:hypothetical protein
MKKIYFDGCSYTWGQSLELYCNPLDIFEHNRMSKYIFTNEDMDFIKKNRYSTQIANHLGFIEKNVSVSSKSNGKILHDLKFENIEDYKYFIIQLTHFDRFFTNGYEWIAHPGCYENLIKEGWFTKENVNDTILNIEKIQYDYFLELQKIFVNYPEKLKLIFHSNEWEEILSKEEIEKYGISIDGEYMIRRWAEKNNMFINQQPQFKFHKASSHDTHLCIEGHKILAESIIKQL